MDIKYPPGWTHEIAKHQDEYRTLPARVVPSMGGRQATVTCHWQPDVEELEALQAGHPVELSIWTAMPMPPVLVSVAETYVPEGADPADYRVEVPEAPAEALGKPVDARSSDAVDKLVAQATTAARKAAAYQRLTALRKEVEVILNKAIEQGPDAAHIMRMQLALFQTLEIAVDELTRPEE